MGYSEYPVDVRVDYPEASSRGWAALTIILIKPLALLPHSIILIFLGVAQRVVAIVAQVVVAFAGEYPSGMFRFVAGVLRWRTRVQAFLFSLTDEYPPFSLEGDQRYPVDLLAERPPRSSRVYAAFTVLVEVIVIVGAIALVWWMASRDGFQQMLVSSSDGSGGTSSYSARDFNFGGSALVLRSLAALPHLIVLVFVWIAVFFVWLVVQWVILFTARFPRGMHDFVAGYIRWSKRVGAYRLGLIDQYPPFTFDRSLPASAGPCGTSGASRPGAVTWPAPPPAPPARPSGLPDRPE